MRDPMKPANLERETMTPRRREKRAIVVLAALAACLLVAGFVEAAVDTTTEVTFSAGPYVVGDSVTVTWTVTAQTTSAVAFGGNLSRRITSPGGAAGDSLDDAPVTSGPSPFTSTHAFVPAKAGTYTVEGNYAGCGGCTPPLNASTGSALLTVDKADTSVAVGSDKAAPVTGETITFTVTVDSPGSGTPTGTVTFYAGGAPIPGGQNVALVGGQAQCTASLNAADSPVQITAAYSGDANYNGSDNTATPLSQTVNPADTTTAVTSTPEPSVTGEDVIFTATVTVDAPGSGTPTGTVTFTIKDKDDNPIATSAPVALDGVGQATYTTNQLKASLSKYKVTATYDGSGDDNYNSSPTSDVYEQQVDKADTSISITSDSPDPSFENQAYNVDWEVIVDVPGSDAPGAPTGGTVTVDDGTDTSASVPVTDTTVPLTSTTTGSKTLTATYTGDDDFNGCDGTTSHTVNSKATSISISSANNPSVIDENVVFTATITPDSSGGPDPTGTVTFKNGAATIGTDNDGSDGWSCTHAFTTAGTKSITAEYSGDGVYSGSTSSAITQTVNKLDLTTLTITSDDNDPSKLDEAYTVKWSVTYPGGTAPTGDVTVDDGGSATPCSNGVMSGATGCALTSTTAGVKTLTASYPGDARFNPATDTETHTVNKGTVSIVVTPTSWTHGTPDSFTATVSAVAPTSGTPSGTVSFHIEDSGGITIANSGPHTLSGGTADSDPVTLTVPQSQVEVYVTYSGDARFDPATVGPTLVTVTPVTWAITADTPDPSLVDQNITIDVSFGTPTDFNGYVRFTISDGVDTNSISYSVTNGSPTSFLFNNMTDIDPGTWDITGEYSPGDDDWGEGDEVDADSAEPHTVATYSTATALSLYPGTVYVNQPTTLDANVTVTGTWTPPSTPGLPGKQVDFSVDAPPGSTGNLSSPYCILVGGADDASCSNVTYTPTASTATASSPTPWEEDHDVTATFPGDSDYAVSNSGSTTLTVLKRPPELSLVFTPEWVYVDQETTITVTVSDSTGMPGSTIPEGTVAFDDNSKAGIFTPGDSGSLTHGTYDATYTPAAGDAGTSAATPPWPTTTIDVDYDGSPIYTTGTTSDTLEVRLRPTETTLTWEDSQGGNDAIYLYETGRVIVTVTDIGPADSASPPQGTLTVTGAPAGLVPLTALTPISGSPNASRAIYSFRMLTASDPHVFVTVEAEYHPVSPQTHDESEGSTEVSVQKRTTETALACTDAAPYPCTATVTDTAPRGDPVTPGGKVVDQADGSDFCDPYAAGACSKNYDTDTPMMQPVAVAYEPGDSVHLGSYGMDIIERPIPTEPGDCGTQHIEDSILGLSITCTVMSALQVLLESGATAADIIADPVWTAIFPGSTVPVGDMIAAGLTGLSLHGEIAIQTMCTDVDGDGIFGSVEAVIAGIEDHDWDSDNDGMGDLDEIDEAGGDLATNYDASKHTSCPCPNPTVADSDGDDIMDGNEQGYFGTDFCNDDTDEDGLSDSQEVGTFAQYNSDSGATITPRTDARDHADPLAADTDGDGLGDYQEFTPGRLADSTTDPDYSSFINDADSDDDDLQDGYEDTNKNGRWEGTIGGSATAGSGETHLCMRDTDGDGLSDGEEVALFGAGSVHVITPTGSTTTPPLDTDSDNDGLSDYEEVNITNTDPLDFDTDDDGLWDVNELMATGGTWPARSFSQVSDPLDPDTDDDDIPDNLEYNGTGLGTGHGLGGENDTECPFVNDDDSDNDGLQDGTEDANLDGTWGVNGSGITVGSLILGTQASKSVPYWETNLCNPDTDGDGLLDGEEVSLLGGEPTSGRPRPSPGFNPVTPEARSTSGPVGPDYSGAGPLYTFAPSSGSSLPQTIPALDVDSDNDGLSDYEEVNITRTDALDQDTDNDTLMDSDELIATGGTPGDHPQRAFDQNSDPLDINTDDDYLFDPVEGSCNSADGACSDATYAGTGLTLVTPGELGGERDDECPYVNNADSDDDGVMDGAVIPISRQGPGMVYSYTFIEGFCDVLNTAVAPPGIIRTVVTPATGEQSTDTICNVCDPDSDSDGLTDGEEVGIGTDPQDWDTDDDGRNDWHEQTGGGPIPTDPFDPDTDDDGVMDSAEVFGSNPTNPVNADTDGDGLCDGGTGTPYMTSAHPTVEINPICKSCSGPGDVGLGSCGTSVRTGSVDGIGDHPNPHGYGEDKNGNGAWDGAIGSLWGSGAPGAPETDPNQYDTDGDGDGDGVEVLGFSTSRQSWIPTADLFGRPINVTYPACGCLEPLIADTDGDQLDDGYEDRNHDGNFDFLPSEFDHEDPLPGPPIPYPTETNPCDPDTDDDDLTDYEERYQSQVYEFYANWDNDGDGLYNEDPVDGIDNDGDGKVDEDPLEPTFNPTNPLDHDTDNDRIYDGPEVKWICTEITFSTLDNDGDALFDEDPVDGLDNDGDGLFDEDDVDFFVRFVPMLDPTNRDSDSDGWLDGLDADPCNSDLIPIFLPTIGLPVDSDKDGFGDEDEEIAGTHPLDPEDYPAAYKLDLDFDTEIDDRLWLEPTACCGIANSVAIDIDCNVLLDARVQIVKQRHAHLGDFDEDGFEDDCRYVIEYAFANYRVLQPRIVATIDDYDCDLVIDWVVVEKK